MRGPRIGLLRHGVTAWNRQGKLQGSVDEPLDPQGRADLRALAPPENWRRARWISSPLSRANETAQILRGDAVETDKRLTEMNFGAWEGLISAELRADPSSGYKDITEWGWSYRPPQGESVEELGARLRSFFAELAARGEDCALVCHMVVMRVALAIAYKWDFAGPAPFQIKRARFYPLRLDAEGRPTPDGPPEALLKKETA